MKKRIAAVTGAALTTMALSGFALWSRWRTEDSLPGLVTTFLVYLVVSHLALVLIDNLRVTTGTRLFLVGGVLGLLLDGVFNEGVLVGFPLTIYATALTWHAVITVVIGWQLLPELLADSSHEPSIKLMVAGVLWAVWAISWWGYDGVRSSVLEFAAVTTVTMVLLAAGLWLRQRARGRDRLRRWPAIAGLGITVAYFWFFGLGLAPMGVFILPMLLGFAMWALHRSRDRDLEPVVVDPGPIPRRRLAVLAVAAATAVVTYSALTVLPINPDTSVVLFWLATPLGYMTLFRYALRPRRLRDASSMARRQSDPAALSGARGPLSASGRVGANNHGSG